MPKAEGSTFETCYPSTGRVRARSSSSPMAASGGANSELLLYARHGVARSSSRPYSGCLAPWRGQAIPRLRRHRHGHAFPPRTLHRWPPKSRTLRVSEHTPPPQPPMGPLKLWTSSLSRRQ